MGFCKCHTGYYGTDCMRKVAGAVLEKGGRVGAGLFAEIIEKLPPSHAHRM